MIVVGGMFIRFGALEVIHTDQGRNFETHVSVVCDKPGSDMTGMTAWSRPMNQEPVRGRGRRGTTMCTPEDNILKLGSWSGCPAHRGGTSGAQSWIVSGWDPAESWRVLERRCAASSCHHKEGKWPSVLEWCWAWLSRSSSFGSLTIYLTN